MRVIEGWSAGHGEQVVRVFGDEGPHRGKTYLVIWYRGRITSIGEYVGNNLNAETYYFRP